MNLFPAFPFTLTQLHDMGISSRRLRDALAAGTVRRVLRGVYSRADLDDDVRHRAAAARLVLPEHVVVSDRSAAWLHGVDAFDPSALHVPPVLEVVSVDGGDRTQRSGVLGGRRDLLPQDIVEIHGIRVTSPLRTACDLACQRGRYAALAVLNAFMREHHLTHEDYRRMVERYAGRRGVRQLRELVAHATGECESQGESWTLMAIIDAGLPHPRPQLWVTLPGWGSVRLDLAYPWLKIVVEYDGEEFHSSDEDREHDRRRRAALREAGWIVIVVTKDDFAGDALDAWLGELRTAIAERTATPRRRYPRPAPESRPVRRRPVHR